MSRTRASAQGLRARHSRPSADYFPRTRINTTYDDRPIEEVWAEYCKTRSDDLRNYLVEKYLHLVKYTAERVYARLPDQVDIADLIQAGFFGLMDAITAYDTDRGIKFETYCAKRIHGAILDQLRHMDWVPRLVRQRTSRYESACQRFEKEHGRRPTEQEISERMGIEGEEFCKLLRDGKAIGTFSLSRKCFQSDGSKDVREIDVIKDERQTNPFTEMQRKDIRDLITKGLSRAERLIVILYYYEEMTMKEIGATLDLSESRVSQMHSSILQRLKAQVQQRSRELELAE